MTRQTTVIEYAGDDFEKLGVLRRKLILAERRATLAAFEATEEARLGDDDEPADELAEVRAEFEEFVDAAAARGTAWVLHAIGHEEFRKLLAQHPPRSIVEGEGEEAKTVTHPDDESWGFNTETFGKALLLWRAPEDEDMEVPDEDEDTPAENLPHRTVIRPVLEPDALARRVKRLAAGEFRTMWTIAEALNSGRLADPKAVLYSLTDQR